MELSAFCARWQPGDTFSWYNEGGHIVKVGTPAPQGAWDSVVVAPVRYLRPHRADPFASECEGATDRYVLKACAVSSGVHLALAADGIDIPSHLTDVLTTAAIGTRVEQDRETGEWRALLPTWRTFS